MNVLQCLLLRAVTSTSVLSAITLSKMYLINKYKGQILYKLKVLKYKVLQYSRVGHVLSI